MALFHYSHNKAFRLAIAIVILLILFPVLFRVIFAAKDEISIAAGSGVSTCDGFYVADESELASCTSTYTVALGNTGSNHQKLVIVDLNSVPLERRLSWNAVDIVATNRRATGPEITIQQLGETLRFEIQDLQPNRMVEIDILSRGVEYAKQMENIDIAVQAEGSIVEASPRLTVSIRFLRNLSGVFGF